MKEITTKKLGFGLMRLPLLDPETPSSINIEEMKRMVDTFIEGGFTYFDTAWMYCGFASENAVKETLVSRHPRDHFTLATKLHAGYLKTEDDRDRIFGEQMKKTGVTFFDYYLLHAVSTSYYETYQRLHCFEWLREKKRAGLCKKIGFSFHDTAEVLDRVLTEQQDMDFVQLQINYLDWESDSIQSRACYEVARKHGVPVVVMEPVKGGTLAAVPNAVREIFRQCDEKASPASFAIRFAASLPGVMMVLSGMSTMEQLQDNMAFMQKLRPLDEQEQTAVLQAASIINSSAAVPCTGCAYCVPACKKRIPIPQYFALYNEDMREREGKDWTPQGAYYDNLAETNGRASECIGCGVCERICPQHLPISKHMKTLARHFE